MTGTKQILANVMYLHYVRRQCSKYSWLLISSFSFSLCFQFSSFFLYFVFPPINCKVRYRSDGSLRRRRFLFSLLFLFKMAIFGFSPSPRRLKREKIRRKKEDVHVLHKTGEKKKVDHNRLGTTTQTCTLW